MIKRHLFGNYTLLLIGLFSISIGLTSCSKEEVVSPIDNPDIQLSSSSRIQDLPELFGFYTTPTTLTIGSASSEDNLLSYLKNKGGNMLNCYARNSMSSSSGRTKFAAFCRKAAKIYGVKMITCDVREISELSTWEAFYTSFPDLRSLVCPLTEKEPWVTRDYSGCFSLLRSTRAMCNRFGAKFYFYEGWMGKNYSNPQAAVDSMVFYCDGVFLSNYVSMSDYLSSNPGYGKWDNRMKYRIDRGASSYGGITVAAQRFNKLNYPIIEIQSLEYSFLFDVYSVSNLYRSFFGSLYQDAKALYNQSSSNVLMYTELKGKTMFHYTYVKEAQPN